MSDLKTQVGNAVLRAYSFIGQNLARDLRSEVVIRLHPMFLGEILRDEGCSALLSPAPGGGTLLMGFPVERDRGVARGVISMHLHLSRAELVDA